MSLAAPRTSLERSDTAPASAIRTRETFPAIVEKSADGAGRLETAQALASSLRDRSDGIEVPENIVARGAEDCLARARMLIQAGKISPAATWLRAAPALAAGRGQLFDISCRAARLDPEFPKLIAAADGLRDAGEWGRAERTYREALRLYPAHAGYIVQYAHCLKERGRLTDAEIQYRSALAYAVHRRTASRYGVSALDILHHIRYVASQRGYHEMQGTSRTTIPKDPGDCDLLLERPTDRDIVLAHELLHNRVPFRDEVLAHLRKHQTLEEVLLALTTRRDSAYSTQDSQRNNAGSDGQVERGE